MGHPDAALVLGVLTKRFSQYCRFVLLVKATLFFPMTSDDEHGVAQIKSSKRNEGLSVSHDGAHLTGGRTLGTRGPASTSQIPASACRNTQGSTIVRGKIVQVESNLQERHRQHEQGDKDALSAKSLTEATPQNQRPLPGS